MTLDHLIGILIGYLFFLVMLLTAPIWLTIMIYKTFNLKLIKNLYYLWFTK